MLKRKNLAIAAALLVMAAVASTGAAQTEDVRRTIVGRFALEVKAGLTGLVTPVVVRLEGRGRANAQRSVLVDIGPLTGSGAKARVEIEPLRRCGPAGNCFHGRGTAVVAVGNRTYKFRLIVRGRMYHTSTGAVMRGSFVSVGTNSKCPRFHGKFAGPKVSLTPAELAP